MPYWPLEGVLLLASIVACVEVFWQTGDYDAGLRRELKRRNQMAALRGEPSITMAELREEVIAYNLAVASRAFQREQGSPGDQSET